MRILLASFGILLPATIIALPFALFSWRLLAGWRSRRASTWFAATTAGLDVAIVVVIAEVLALTMMPVGTGHKSSVHLIPGSDIITEFRAEGSLWQIAGNLVLLAPLGVLLPLRVRRLRSIPRMTAIAFVVSAAIELAQYLAHAGRVTSTDDVLLNTLGVAAASTLSCGWVSRPRAIPARSRPEGEDFEAAQDREADYLPSS
ncbi:MAG TPA: VanZ family protein [Amycolatopsis sp.]|jgi:glycopeptide antibiotics resistance protein|nr:VanZ family protein [Amycolatopsis sp.]